MRFYPEARRSNFGEDSPPLTQSDQLPAGPEECGSVRGDWIRCVVLGTVDSVYRETGLQLTCHITCQSIGASR